MNRYAFFASLAFPCCVVFQAMNGGAWCLRGVDFATMNTDGNDK